MTLPEFQAELERLSRNFKKQYTADQAEIMWRRLKFFPREAMRRCVDNLICEEKYQPFYNEIHAALRRVMAGSSDLKMIPGKPKNAPKIECAYCDDTGIRLREHRQDPAKDFYCGCRRGEELPQLDWDNDRWRSMLSKVGTKEFASAFRQTCRDEKITIGINLEPFDLEVPF